MTNTLVISYPYEKIYAVHKIVNTTVVDFFHQLDEIKHINGFDPMEEYELNQTSVADLMTTLIDNGTSNCPDNCDIYYDIWLSFNHVNHYRFALCAENFDTLETLISQG